MPWLEAFCSVKLFPLQPKDPPTKEGFFFFFLQKIIFLVTFGVLWLQEDEGGGGDLWKGQFLFIHIYFL